MPPDRPAPGERNPWLALLAVALGQFMVVVDVTILNIALPSIAQELGTDLPDLEWALISYSVTMIGLVPIFGRVADVVGRKRLYVLGLAVFALASAIAAASPNIAVLVAARVLQAVGGALITSNTLAIVTDVFPAGKRGAAMGVQSVLISGGAASGPVLGGFLVTHFGWESVFLVNLPVGLLSAVLAQVLLPRRRRDVARTPLDLAGAALLLVGLVSSLLGLTRAPEWGWADPRTLVAFAIGAPLLALFAVRQGRVEHPLVKPSLLRIRAFALGQLARLVSTCSLVAMVFMLPFYWQALRGLSAQDAGLLMLPIPLSIGALGPISGRLSDRVGARGLCALGMTVVAIAALLLSRIDEATAVPDVLWRLAVFGVGVGLFIAPNNNLVMSAAPADDRGVAAGLVALSRYTGQAIGIAMAGTIFVHAAGGSEELIAADGIAPGEASARFVDGFRTVCLVILPIALAGAALSFAAVQRSGGRADAAPT